MTKRDDYVSHMKLQMDEMNTRMHAAEAKLAAVKADAKAMYEKELEAMKERSKSASKQFDAMKTSSEEVWETMVADMDKMRDAFAHSFNYFKSQV